MCQLVHGLGEVNLRWLSRALLTKLSQNNCLARSRQHRYLHDKDKYAKETILKIKTIVIEYENSKPVKHFQNFK